MQGFPVNLVGAIFKNRRATKGALRIEGAQDEQ